MSCCVTWRDSCATCQVAEQSQRPKSHPLTDPQGSNCGMTKRKEKKEEEEEGEEKEEGKKDVCLLVVCLLACLTSQ